MQRTFECRPHTGGGQYRTAVQCWMWRKKFMQQIAWTQAWTLVGPHIGTVMTDDVDPSWTNCIRSERYDLIHVIRTPWTSKLRSSRVNITECSTISKAADRSKATIQRTLYFINFVIYVLHYAQQCSFGQMVTAICRLEDIESLRPGYVSANLG